MAIASLQTRPAQDFLRRVTGNATRAFWSVLAIAFAARIAWWIAYVTTIENDGAEFSRLATNLRDGIGYVGILGGDHVLLPPLYPILIAVISPLTGDPETAARLISLVAGLVLVFAVHRVTRELLGPGTALIAAASAALYPLLIGLSVTAYSESLSLALLVIALYATIRMLREPSFARSITLGLLFGATYLARPDSGVFAAVAATFIAIAAIARRWRMPIAARYLIALLLTSAVVAAPYVGHLSAGSGALRFDGKTDIDAMVKDRLRTGMTYPEAARGLGSDLQPHGPYLVADQFELLRRHQGGRLDWLSPILSQPGSKLRSLVYDVATNRALGFPYAGLLVVLGLFATRWWRISPIESSLCLAFSGAQVVTLMLLEVRFERHDWPLLPLLLPWVAAGIERLVPRACVYRALPIFASVAMILAISLASYHASVVALDESRDRHLRYAGLWIREDFSGSKPIVATNGAVIPYYARGTLSYLPFTPEASALSYLRTVRPNYIAVVSTDKRQAPYIPEWLQRDISDSCAEPANNFRGDDGEVVKVWRWSCAAATAIEAAPRPSHASP